MARHNSHTMPLVPIRSPPRSIHNPHTDRLQSTKLIHTNIRGIIHIVMNRIHTLASRASIRIRRRTSRCGRELCRSIINVITFASATLAIVLESVEESKPAHNVSIVVYSGRGVVMLTNDQLHAQPSLRDYICSFLLLARYLRGSRIHLVCAILHLASFLGSSRIQGDHLVDVIISMVVSRCTRDLILTTKITQEVKVEIIITSLSQLSLVLKLEWSINGRCIGIVDSIVNAFGVKGDTRACICLVHHTHLSNV